MLIHTGFYICIILTFQHNLQYSVPNKIVYLVYQVNNNVCKSFNTPEDDSLNDPLFSDSSVIIDQLARLD